MKCICLCKIFAFVRLINMVTLFSANEGNSATVDSTLVAVLVILFTGMCILFVFIICLLWSRRKLRHIMKFDDSTYFAQVGQEYDVHFEFSMCVNEKIILHNKHVLIISKYM